MLQDTVDMQSDRVHIDPERLAAFDQEPPTPDEVAHLAGCALCRREQRAFQSLASLAAATAAVAPTADRLTEWDDLAARLRTEGLLTSPADVAPVAVSSVSVSPMTVSPMTVSPMTVSRAERAVATGTTSAAAADLVVGPARRVVPAWLRVAAALVLTAGGAFLGRVSAGAPLLGDAPAAVGGAGAGATPVALAGADGDGFGSVSQATDALSRAQREYERASLWLAANDTTVHSSDVYRARLAALDEMMTASRAALRDAPQDPVLNHYFLAAYTAREATLQALGGALPVDKSLERY